MYICNCHGYKEQEIRDVIDGQTKWKDVIYMLPLTGGCHTCAAQIKEIYYEERYGSTPIS